MQFFAHFLPVRTRRNQWSFFNFLCFGHVGHLGFEPRTSDLRGQRSDQAELMTHKFIYLCFCATNAGSSFVLCLWVSRTSSSTRKSKVDLVILYLSSSLARTPDRIRTCNPEIRNLVRYPVALQRLKALVCREDLNETLKREDDRN